MHGPTTLTLAFCVVAVSAPGLRGQELPPDSAEVHTEGVAHRSVRPDLATLNLRFVAVDSTPMRAGQRLAARADTLRRALASVGIPPDSLITLSRWRWWQQRVRVLVQRECVQVEDMRRCVPVVDTTYEASIVIAPTGFESGDHEPRSPHPRSSFGRRCMGAGA